MGLFFLSHLCPVIPILFSPLTVTSVLLLITHFPSFLALSLFLPPFSFCLFTFFLSVFHLFFSVLKKFYIWAENVKPYFSKRPGK